MKCRKKTVSYSLSAFSFTLALVIYVLFRSPNYYIQVFIQTLGIEELIIEWRMDLSALTLPDWILYGLPDFLWMFSFMTMIVANWNFKITRNSVIWISITGIVGLGIEISQLFYKKLGVYDFTDLLFLTAGIICALLFTIDKDFKSQIYEVNRV